MPLPIAVRTAAMQAQDEGDRLAFLQVARVIEKVGAARFHLGHVALIDDGRAAAFLYLPGKPPQLLPELLTPERVREALDG